MNPPIAIDLFSGCGGLTLGLKQAGFRVIGAVEIDSFSVETYRANHKEVSVWEQDIRDLDPLQMRCELMLEAGELDVLAGCPPCQGFSTLRTLNGGRKISDPRNDLLFDFLRFVRAFRPKALMMENVPGLAGDSRIKIFGEELTGLGYYNEWRVLDAADYGVPQRRRRMILLAGLNGPIEFAPPSTVRRTVRHAIGDLPESGRSEDPLHNFPEKRSPRIRDMISRIPKNGGSRSDLGEEYRLDCHKRCNGFKDVYGRMVWDEVAPTITGGCVNPSKGRFLHPDADRTITLREAALLQSFPPDYSFLLDRGKFKAAELIGNALPPEFVRQHAGRVVSYVTRLSGGCDGQV